MEINSFNSIPTNPQRRADRSTASNGQGQPVEGDRFVGPNVEAKIQSLKTMNGSREELIEQLQKEVREGSYLNQNRIQDTVEKMLSSL